MSDFDSPAGTPGGPVPVPTSVDLPEKMRVHVLARLIGRSGREVLAALAELGVEARSVQSSVTRKDAEQVMTLLVPDAAVPAAQAGSAPAAAFATAAEPAPVVEPPAAPAEGAPALAPLFAAPLFQPPEPATRTRGRRKAVAPEEPAANVEPGSAADAPVAADPADAVDAADSPDAAEPDADDEDGGDGRRRRRRGRRGRGRGRGADDTAEDGDSEDSEDAEGTDTTDAADATDTDPAGSESDDGTDTESDDDDQGGSRRRRRRRRRRGAGDESDDGPADPPNTVTRVRAPRERGDDREDGDGVQSVRGSTRLEAKRQRRRDGRDAGRRRVPILSEAEFLARRESVDRAMVVRERGDRIEIGVLEDDVLVEHFVTGGGDGQGGQSIVGNIYLGRVQNVLPSMEAAFVDIGRGRNAVLYAGEVDWDAAGLGGKARRIEQALSSGDSVLVQVTKDPLGHKGARLTTQLSLAGRFLVYVPSGGAAGISRKLPDVERKRLKDMLKEIVPSEAGVIIRTASEGVSHQALERDVRRLQAQWEVVKEKSEKTGPGRPKAPVLLYEEPDLLVKVVRDQFNEDFSRLVVAGDDAWDTVSHYISHVAPELVERLHRHVGPNDVFAEYRIDEQLLKALDRKVWLPSGGTLVIDRTEAMTVIDVNTGKFTGSGGNLEETVTRNNLEAAEEVVRQLRLRDIGGIIVIDFIDMVLEANRDLVLRRLTECLARDRTRHQVAEVTSLGLVQMTRKRVGGGLLEHFSTTCEHCRGRGVVVTSEPVTERDETGRGPEREGRRSRGGRGRRGAEQLGDGGRNGQSGGSDGSGSSSGGRRRATDDVPVAPVPVASSAVAPAEADVAAEPAVEDVAPQAEPAAVVPAPAEIVPTEPVPAAAEAAPVEAPAVSVTDTPTFGAAAPSPASTGTPAAHNGNGHAAAEAPAPKPRRRAVRRTAGAPGGEAAVAVVTVPVAEPDAAAPASPAPTAPAGVAPQPEPTATSRPRRARRAASRPAGPPVADEVAERAAASVPGGDGSVTAERAAASVPGGDGSVTERAAASEDPV